MHRLLTAPLRLFAPLKRVAYGLLFAAGIGVAVLFIATSLFIDVRAVAVLLAAIGAALGALIVALAMPKLLVMNSSARERQLAAQVREAMVQRAQMAGEIERLKAQQLQIQQVQAVLKLTLLEVETTLTDFKEDDLGRHERPLGGEEQHRYVGVLRRRARVMLGMDLTRLRIRVERDCITVDGLHAEFQGVRETQDDWLLRQVQVRQDNLVLSNKTVVLDEAPRLFEASNAQQAELDARMRSGIELRGFDAALEALGRQWLMTVLAPLGLSVRFAPLAEADCTPFMHYLQQRAQGLLTTQHRLEGLVAAEPLAPPDDDRGSATGASPGLGKAER